MFLSACRDLRRLLESFADLVEKRCQGEGKKGEGHGHDVTRGEKHQCESQPQYVDGGNQATDDHGYEGGDVGVAEDAGEFLLGHIVEGSEKNNNLHIGMTANYGFSSTLNVPQ